LLVSAGALRVVFDAGQAFGQDAAPEAPTASGATPSSPAAASPAALRRRVLEAEDARDGSPDGIAPMLEALKSRDTETRRMAVRALGRLERPALAAAVAQALTDPGPVVRAEAANALGQTVRAGGDLSLASELLFAQLERETHPMVRGILAFALGGLPYKDVDAIRRAERAIVAALKAPAADSQPRSDRDIPSERREFAGPVTLLGGLRGLESLARLHAKTAPLESATLQLLRDLAVVWRSAVARSEGGPTSEAAARLRRLAIAALISARGADANTVSVAFGDADDQVRRLAAQAAAAADPVDTKFVDRAIRDQSAMVRTEILLAMGRRDHPATCGYASLVLRDPDPQVAITAIDVAARACSGNAPAIAAVAARANQLLPPPLRDVGAERSGPAGDARIVFGPSFHGSRQAAWQPASHALVSLAQLAPEQVRGVIEKHAADSRWQVRMYAARAAGRAKLDLTLRKLADDANDNVRSAALAGLREAIGHDADAAFLSALARDDEQLLMTAAQSLQGTSKRDEAAPALLDALDRLTTRRRETSRDARQALVDRIAEVGGPANAARLEPYLRDFDPAIAEKAAAALTTWTGAAVKAVPQTPPRPDLPSSSDLDALGAARIVVTVRDVGRFELKLLPQEAPLNAWRFSRLARAGAYTGSTFHRVVPNFILQGGSPADNEYTGHGAFTRDEFGLLSNSRGTIGLSTRGRDTGDGQWYINLVDNDRLDHAYTVFAQVERGGEMIDDILEGDVIERVEVVGR
jgi:cyclophilin family peptidyl-prolyl cis-trans isomerase/HEAT repeat protein